MERTFPDNKVALVHKARCCGFSSSCYNLNLGWHVLVVNLSDVKTGDQELHQKTDALNSKNRSNQLKAGVLRSAYIPTEAHEQFTTLAHHSIHITNKLRQSKSHIKSMLHFKRIETPTAFDHSNGNKDFMVWLENIEFISLCVKLALQGEIRTYNFIRTAYLEIANQMLAHCRTTYKNDYHLSRSILGSSGYLYSEILALCGDLRQCKYEGQYNSYIGLVRGIYNTGATEKCLGITPRNSCQLRS